MYFLTRFCVYGINKGSFRQAPAFSNRKAILMPWYKGIENE